MTKIIKRLVISFLMVMVFTICECDKPVFADEETVNQNIETVGQNIETVNVEAPTVPVETEPDIDLLYITGYQLDNQTIIAGKDFTLKLTIENYSAEAQAENVIVMIDNPAGVVPEYGTVSVQYLDTIAPKESKEVMFRYRADTDIEATELDFIVCVISDTNTTTTPIRLSVGREGDFFVDEYTIPEKFVIGKREYISALIENVSGKDIDNVAMVVKCDGEVLTSQNIGTMLAGISKTEYVNVMFEDGDSGEHSYELLLTYADGAGESKEYIISTGMFNIAEKADEQETYDVNNGNSNASADGLNEEGQPGINNVVVICTIGIIMIAICCVVLILIYRRR